MLLGFSVENWMSFRDPVTFSMIASKERQHGERLSVASRYGTRVLPIAAIYGGNASGKTNFFRAMHFAKWLIVRGTLPDALIPIEPFRLDPAMRGRPVRLGFMLLIDDALFDYRFALTREAVVEERLLLVRSQHEEVLFDRKDGAPHFAKRLANEPALTYAFKGTRDNQLFLTNSVSQRIDAFKPVHDWFRDTLELIAPDSRFGPIEQLLHDDRPIQGRINDLLPQLDTGITRLGHEDVPFDSIPWPDGLRRKLQEEVLEGVTVRLAVDPSGERMLVTRQEGELRAIKLVTHHRRTDGVDEQFEMAMESDGTKRIIDLLPAFLDLAAPRSGKVYVIDELDRSLHTLLTRRLLEAYLGGCGPTSRSQLLLTTHDVLLMDQSLLRRDEMWVAERTFRGDSTLTSFSEFKDVRYDKDIRKSYLHGRLGGIPQLLLHGAFTRRTSHEDTQSEGRDTDAA